MQNKQGILETLEEARPFIRSIVAFVAYLRFSSGMVHPSAGPNLDRYYMIADAFVNRLKGDVENA